MATAQSQDSEAQRPLYARLMQAIDVQHTWGNRVGFVKLPLIMLDIRLYGGAIAQFYMVTEALEAHSGLVGAGAPLQALVRASSPPRSRDESALDEFLASDVELLSTPQLERCPT